MTLAEFRACKTLERERQAEMRDARAAIMAILIVGFIVAIYFRDCGLLECLRRWGE